MYLVLLWPFYPEKMKFQAQMVFIRILKTISLQVQDKLRSLENERIFRFFFNAVPEEGSSRRHGK